MFSVVVVSVSIVFLLHHRHALGPLWQLEKVRCFSAAVAQAKKQEKTEEQQRPSSSSPQQGEGATTTVVEEQQANISPSPTPDGQPRQYSAKIVQIVEAIASLTLVEVADLNEALKVHY